MDPLISIITVTYNASGVVETTLQSVAEQTFVDYEHIIIDGKSADATVAIASRFSNPRLQIYSKPDSGIYHAMNRGLRLAHGRYVLFLNAGDSFATGDTLMKYARAAMEGKDIIYGDTVIVDRKGKILRPRHLQAPRILTYKSYLQGMLICHQAFMVRREIAPEYSREFRLSADYDWCMECIAKSRITQRHNLNAVTIHFLEGGMTSKLKLKSLRERFIIMKRRFGLLAALKAHIGFIPRALLRKTL